MGSPPFTRKDLGTGPAKCWRCAQVIREQEPSKPSTKLSTAEGLPTLAANRSTEPAKLAKLVRGELDWIVMKALEKDRNRRYETANGFAMDVQRYLADEPVLACPPSAAYRLRKFARRNKAALAVAGLVLLCITLVGGVGGWVVRDRAARQREADGRAIEALDAAGPRLQDGHPWDPALIAAAQRVEAALEGGTLGPDVRARAEQLRRDVRMLVDMDEIRLRYAESKEGGMFDSFGCDRRFREAFAAYGIDVAALDVSDASARVRGSAIREPLLAGLGAWVRIKPAGDSARPRLRAVVDGADGNAWRRTFRAAAEANDTGKLMALATQAEAFAQTPDVLIWLGTALYDGGAVEEARAVIRKAQQRYPDDFWINYILGRILVFDPPLRAPRSDEAAGRHDAPRLPGGEVGLRLRRSDEAVGYLRVAVAARPSSAEARSLLGVSLHLIGDVDGAIRAYEEAIRLDPSYMWPHSNLWAPLLAKGDFHRAIAECTEAIRLKPDIVVAWRQRAGAYRELHQWDKVVADLSVVLRLDPTVPWDWGNRGYAYMRFRAGSTKR